MYENIKEVIGDNEYGETPYLVSEMIGNSSRDVIVFAYDESKAIDAYVDHGEKTHGWEVPDGEIDHEDEGFYFAKGYFPIDLDYLSIQTVDENDIERILDKFKNEKEKDIGMEL